VILLNDVIQIFDLADFNAAVMLGVYRGHLTKGKLKYAKLLELAVTA
jgi:hypothetical protein